MSEVHLTFDGHGGGRFSIEHDGEPVAYLTFHIRGNVLTAIHTDVLEAWSGHGLGARLVQAMVDYARAHKLNIVPLCPYVRSQFEKNPELYKDVWEAIP